MHISDNQDEITWPAFVDALTTMTMILTFVMLILAVAVGSLSQNASKIFVDTFNEIARERGTQPLTPKTTRSELIAAIKDIKLPAPNELQPEQAAPQKAPPKEIVSAEMPVTAKPPALVASAPTQGLLKLSYPVRQTRLDPTAEKSLKDFLNSSKEIAQAGEIAVQAFAPLSAGSLTEARRVAYYRAMLVRARLLNLGIPADKIVLKVDDRFNEKEGDSVTISVGSKPVN
jgi:hypothetical protein